MEGLKGSRHGDAGSLPPEPGGLPGRAELERLGDLARDTALGAAEWLRTGLERDQIEVVTKSSGTDLASEMDRGAERIIVEALLGERPDDGVLGEEGADRAGTSGLRWVIDPLDGTTNYLYRHPGFSVSIAAEWHGRAVVGVVVDVPTGEVFRAVIGAGATRDGIPITVSTETEIARALVATGFGYQPAQRRHQGAVLSGLIDQIRDIRRMGSAALDLCSVACGRVDAYYEFSASRWDWSAGALIATEAGAMVMDLAGTFPASAPIIAAPPALAHELRTMLIAAGANDVPN